MIGSASANVWAVLDVLELAPVGVVVVDEQRHIDGTVAVAHAHSSISRSPWSCQPAMMGRRPRLGLDVRDLRGALVGVTLDRWDVRRSVGPIVAVAEEVVRDERADDGVRGGRQDIVFR